ncbi:hypothetical protein OH76DRAFT_375968 [Lentinus brumalis]|uniref:Fungal-type protein kinase domain-containing protein n=1 Tax=Lentinus brumalis TaxID=2498619 RepID=A0A371CJ08_9APHY|nr:hypothetical protein OH76DRAFT_375968 [Polyporus brumalis]
MRWVPCRVDDWFERCMPGTEAPPEGMAFEAMDVPRHGPKRRMYPGIHKGCIGYLNTVGCTDFTVRCTDPLKDEGTAEVDSADELTDYNTDRPDLVVFPTYPDALEAYRWKGDVKQPGAKHSPASGSTQGPLPVSDVSRDEIPDRDASEAQDAPVFRGQMSWAWAEVVIEVERSRDHFPFLHATGGKTAGFPDGETHVFAREQIAEHAVEVFKHQHRLFVFTILILDDHARLACFDRKGAMVSQAFDYRKYPQVLGQFFYRAFNPAARREQRGYDPTACVASNAEQEIFVNAHKAFANAPVVEKALKRAVSASYPVYKINMTGRWSADGSPLTTESPGTLSTHVCLVGRPEFCSASLVGRGTKGFVALDIGLAPDDGLAPNVACSASEEVVAPKAIFIKDTWRTDSSAVVPEGEHYKVLWSKALSEESDEADPDARKAYIPTLICMGDVVSAAAHVAAGSITDPSAPSSTSQTTEAPQVQRTLPRPLTRPDGDLPRIHHRIAIKEICSTLEDFSDPYELMVGVYFALLAHQFAWEKCGILHRDISVGNILLYYVDGPRRIGLLADWDLAKTKEQLQKQQATQTSRAGTWPFMSALLQKYANKPHELADDLESFLHVLNWCAWKYFWHEVSSRRANLAMMFFMMFDMVVQDPPELAQSHGYSSVARGYADKLRYVRNGVVVVQGLPEGHPFTILLAEVTAIIKQHYDTIDFAALDKPIAPQQTSTRVASVPRLVQLPRLDPRDMISADVRQRLEAKAKETAASRVGSTISAQGTAAAATGVVHSGTGSSSVQAARSTAVSPLQDHISIMDSFYDLLDPSNWEDEAKHLTLWKIENQVPYFDDDLPNSRNSASSPGGRGSKRSGELASEVETSTAYVPGDVFSSQPASGQQVQLKRGEPDTRDDSHNTEKDEVRKFKKAKSAELSES